MKKTQSAILVQEFKGAFSRNWQAKLVAVVLAFLFWYSVKSEIISDGRRQRFEEALQQHSLGGATRL
jgi:hypothetical protein